MFSLVRVPAVSLETARVKENFSPKGCWHEPIGLRENTLRKARRDGLDSVT